MHTYWVHDTICLLQESNPMTRVSGLPVAEQKAEERHQTAQANENSQDDVVSLGGPSGCSQL
jgi:hypothetical protein